MKSLKKFFFASIPALVLAVIFLYGVEWYYHAPIHGDKVGQAYTWGHPVKRNSFSFREREITVPKPPNVYRVMVLGDSFTYGTGLPEEKRFTDLLDAALTERARKPRIEVLNFAESGNDTVDERNDLLSFKDRVVPDQIVVGFCFNDMSKLYYGKNRAQFEQKFYFWTGPIFRGMRKVGLRQTEKILRDGFFRFLELVHVFPEWRDELDKMYEKSSPEWKDFAQALRDIKSMSDALKLPPPIFAVLNHGMYRDRPTDYKHPDKRLRQYLKWCHQAEAAAKEIGFITLNYEKEIGEELSNEILSVNQFDDHPGEALNKLYARKLLPVILNNLTKTKRLRKE